MAVYWDINLGKFSSVLHTSIQCVVAKGQHCKRASREIEKKNAVKEICNTMRVYVRMH